MGNNVLTPEEENDYLRHYFEGWKESDEYHSMTKKQVQEHLEHALADYRILAAKIQGWREAYHKIHIYQEALSSRTRQ